MTETFAVPAGFRVDELGFVTVPAGRIAAGSADGFAVRDMVAHMALERRTIFWNASKVGKASFDNLDEVQFLLVKRGENEYALALPLISGNLRAYLRGSGESLQVVWDGLAPGEAPVDATLLLVISGDDPLELARRGVRMVRERLGSFRLREEKPRPELLKYLGWCTWDAFYKDVTAEKVLQGLKTFADGAIHPGVVILDDGWLDTDENEYLNGFPANAAKFPGGLAPMIAEAKSRFGVKLFGVWHAFQGYWRGVKAETFGEKYRLVQNTGRIRPWAPNAFDVCFVHPDDSYRFYQEFHGFLRQQGVDFVKVDGQSATEQFSINKLGRVDTMRAYQYAYQGSIQTHFGGVGISCMCNGSDVAYNMLAAAIWRNSDDFYPNKPASHAVHLITNAMNSLWSGEFCIPDWDMFWSNAPEGEFHAMARAISGGPVYVSDKPGEHDYEVLGKLVVGGNRALISDRPALPAGDGIFIDYSNEARLLKITNRSGGIGVIGAFNCRVVDGDVTDSISPADLPDVPGKEFAVYLHRARTVQKVTRRGSVEVTLPRLGRELAVVSPVLDGWIAPLGLIEKYNSPAAISRMEMVDDGELVVELVDGGVIGFWCAAEPALVAPSCKGKVSYQDGLLKIETRPGEPVKIQITRSAGAMAIDLTLQRKATKRPAKRRR